MEEFTVEAIISFQEYLKDKKVLKKIILVAILLIAISLIVFIKDLNIIFLFASMSIFILYLSCIIGCLIIIFYYYCYNKDKYSFKYSLIFHKNYIERKGNGINEKISFDDIIEIKENSNRFIFQLKTFPIKISKSNCHKKDINFIRKTMHKKEKNFQYEKINKILNWLFIITIILFIVSITVNLWVVENITNNTYQYMWTMYLLLPFSLISMYMGLKYKAKIFSSLKNIISGVLITFLILSYGSLSLIPTHYVDYQEVSKLDNILGIELPATGTYQKEKIRNSHLNNHIVHKLFFKEKTEYLKVEQEIKASRKWLKSQDISRELSYFIPVVCNYNNCYYSIYFVEVGKHNTLPNKGGIYHIYSMLYNYDEYTIRIDEYTVNY